MNKSIPGPKVAILDSDYTTTLAQTNPQFIDKYLTVLRQEPRLDELISNFEISEFQAVKSSISKWIPIFNRRSPAWYQYDLVQDLISLQVIAWAKKMRDEGAAIALFETAASHHFNTIAFELACDLIGLDKVFLTHTAFTNRLVPIHQNGSYANRNRLNGFHNEYCLPLDLFDTNSTTWKKRTSLQNSFEKSSLLFYFIIISKFFKVKVAKNIEKRLSLRNSTTWDDWIEQRFGYGLLDEIKLHRLHKKAIKTIRKRESEDEPKLRKFIEEKQFLDSSPIFLIYASFQPEASSFPLGDYFASHRQIVMAIKKKYPRSRIIYHEHPHIERWRLKSSGSRVSLYRSPEYFDFLADLGCLFANNNLTKDLESTAERNVVVVTIGGNIAIERAMKGLPTIVAGNPWYKSLPGTMTLLDFLGDDSGKPIDLVEEKVVRQWIIDFHLNNTLSQPPWSYAGFHGSNSTYYKDLTTLIDYLMQSNAQV